MNPVSQIKLELLKYILPFVIAMFAGVVHLIVFERRWTIKIILTDLISSGFAGVVISQLAIGMGFNEGLTTGLILLGGFGGTYSVMLLYNKFFTKKLELGEDTNIEENTGKEILTKVKDFLKSKNTIKDVENDSEIKLHDECKSIDYNESIKDEKMYKLLLINLFNCSKINAKEYEVLSDVYVSRQLIKLIIDYDKEKITKQEFLDKLKRL